MRYGEASLNAERWDKEISRLQRQVQVYRLRIEKMQRRIAHLEYMHQQGSYALAQPRLHMINDFEDEDMGKVLP